MKAVARVHFYAKYKCGVWTKGEGWNLPLLSIRSLRMPEA